MIYIGVDPGKNGGIAVLSPEIGGLIAEVYPYTPGKLIEVIKSHEGQTRATVEQVGARPHQGVVSMFHFGECYGGILGILQALDVPTATVTPQKWKKALKVTKDKATAIARAKELYPTTNLFATPRCRKEHDGMAEALLIATYGYRWQTWR